MFELYHKLHNSPNKTQIIVFENYEYSHLKNIGGKFHHIKLCQCNQAFALDYKQKSIINIIPFDSNTIDAVLIKELTRAQLNVRNIFLTEITRVLKPNGLIIGSDYFSSIQKEEDALNVWSCVQDFRDHIEDKFGWYFLSTTPDLNDKNHKKQTCFCINYSAYNTSKNDLKTSHSLKSKNIFSLASNPLNFPNNNSIIVSGISLGLPNYNNKNEPFFDKNNFEKIFNGQNFLCRLNDDDIQKILDQNVYQIDKKDGKRVKIPLLSRKQIIKIVSKLGHFDLENEYHVPHYMVEALDLTCKLAVAAGLEAVKSAGIMLVKDNKSEFALPEKMRDNTGIIFASSFPQMETIVDSVKKYCAHKYSNQSDKFDLIKEYNFDRKLLFKLLVLANSQLAELLRAKGPNTSINAACASTSQAICIASDWVSVGRCSRVIVISADNASSDNLLEYIGTGFLSVGAATIKATISEAAVPFDKSRSGMILGMGAVGLVFEKIEATIERGSTPLVQLIATHFVNSAFHGVLLDKTHIADELEKFISKLENEKMISRHVLSKDLLYFSHETGTSAYGGCAKAECDALFHVFGDSIKNIMICSTKGLTGHPMGVGIEDVMAVASLVHGKTPPIPNTKTVDSSLNDIQLSNGKNHKRKYALRLAAGFGSQFAFVLFKKFEKHQCSFI